MGGLWYGEGSVGKSKHLGGTLYAEGAQGSIKEGKGCQYRFPLGEKIHLSTSWDSGIPLPFTSCKTWGKLLKWSVHQCLTCNMGK